jgi:hypothetical protein
VNASAWRWDLRSRVLAAAALAIGLCPDPWKRLAAFPSEFLPWPPDWSAWEFLGVAIKNVRAAGFTLPIAALRTPADQLTVEVELVCVLWVAWFVAGAAVVLRPRRFERARPVAGAALVATLLTLCLAEGLSRAVSGPDPASTPSLGALVLYAPAGVLVVFVFVTARRWVGASVFGVRLAWVSFLPGWVLTSSFMGASGVRWLFVLLASLGALAAASLAFDPLREPTPAE